MDKVIYADKFFLKDKTIGPGYLTLKDGNFSSFNSYQPENMEIIDYSGKWIAPGLVDTHIHGYNGQDIMDNSFSTLNQISEGLLSCGVTSFLPTTLTSSTDLIDQVVELVGKEKANVTGAKIKGIFLEGPFFTEKHKGAQNSSYFMDPSIEYLKKWQTLSGDFIKKIAIAPERKDVSNFINYALKENIVIGLAHSDAPYEEAKNAVEDGASIFVHTYNGMSGFHHRELGMVGAAMDLDNIFAELICDGHHVHPKAVEILMNNRGREQTVLITDCMRAGGLPDGNESSLGEFPVFVNEGAARLENGSLAGSVLELQTAVKNVVDWGIATPKEAINMASTVPAKSVNIENEAGEIKKDRNADFIVLTPELDLVATYLDGELRYKNS